MIVVVSRDESNESMFSLFSFIVVSTALFLILPQETKTMKSTNDIKNSNRMNCRLNGIQCPTAFRSSGIGEALTVTKDIQLNKLFGRSLAVLPAGYFGKRMLWVVECFKKLRFY